MRKIFTLFIAALCSATMFAAPDGAINGKFSVSADKQVYFSQGNLQYQWYYGDWSFAEHQWDVIGADNANITDPYYQGYIDLFGWGTSGYNDKFPQMASTTDTDYGPATGDIAGTLYDWGNVAESMDLDTTWRTLTADEWNYLLNTRDNASNLRSIATVNGQTGLVVLPDDWDLTARPIDATATDFATNTFSDAKWVTWEVQGAVFLPAAGLRGGTSIYSVNSYGFYWSSSAVNETKASSVRFSAAECAMYDLARSRGASVRLVQDVKYTLNGEFSVADGKQIQFSKGNLQYHCKNQTWRFAPKQTDVIGADNANIAADYDGFIDLFGWGTGNNPTQASTNSNGSEYSTYTDWGTNIGEPNEWRTLSNDEWRYLFYGRNDAATLFAFATVNNVPGVVLLPDDWETPTGLTFTASTTQGLEDKGSYYGSSVACYSHNTYTAEQWQIMETAGAVFLPATGYRNGTTVEDFNSMDKNGYYWSSTSYNSTRANSLYFTRIALYPSSSSGTPRKYGYSVRLVQDVTGAPEAIDNTPFPSGEGRGEAHKRIVNGQLIIEKNGRTYNAIGAEVK